MKISASLVNFKEFTISKSNRKTLYSELRESSLPGKSEGLGFHVLHLISSNLNSAKTIR